MNDPSFDKSYISIFIEYFNINDMSEKYAQLIQVIDQYEIFAIALEYQIKKLAISPGAISYESLREINKKKDIHPVERVGERYSLNSINSEPAGNFRGKHNVEEVADFFSSKEKEIQSDPIEYWRYIEAGKKYVIKWPKEPNINGKEFQALFECKIGSNKNDAPHRQLYWKTCFPKPIGTFPADVSGYLEPLLAAIKDGKIPEVDKVKPATVGPTTVRYKNEKVVAEAASKAQEKLERVKGLKAIKDNLQAQLNENQTYLDAALEERSANDIIHFRAEKGRLDKEMLQTQERLKEAEAYLQKALQQFAKAKQALKNEQLGIIL